MSDARDRGGLDEDFDLDFTREDGYYEPEPFELPAEESESTGRAPAWGQPMQEDRTSKLKRRGLYAALLLLAFGLMTVVAIRNDGTTTDFAVTSSDGIEALIPARGDEVLRQSDVGADLAPGFRGELSINGVDIPDNFLQRPPDNALNEVITRPGDLGRDAEGQETIASIFPRLDADTNCAEITFWPEDRPEQTETVRWCFQAT